jgi:hypothetical protein
MVDRCRQYDQLSDRYCAYDLDHGGSCNFARLDHDTRLERQLRRALDEMTKDAKDALALFTNNWCPEHGHAPTAGTFAKAKALAKILGVEVNLP